MVKSDIERVFPYRNRMALEGSPERTAVENNQNTIQTTFGHVATKVFELISPYAEQSRIQEIVLKIFPSDIHRQSVEVGQYHVIMAQINRELRELFMGAIHIQRKQFVESIRSDIRSIELEAEKNDDKCISVTRFVDWLRVNHFSALEELTSEDIIQMLVNFCYWIGRGYWDQELQEGNLLADTLKEKLHVTDIQKFPDAIADWKLKTKLEEAHCKSRNLYAQIKGLFITTPLVKQNIVEKYPIKEGN